MELALEVKFHLELHWVTRPWLRTLTKGSDVKYVFPLTKGSDVKTYFRGVGIYRFLRPQGRFTDFNIWDYALESATITQIADLICDEPAAGNIFTWSALATYEVTAQVRPLGCLEETGNVYENKHINKQTNKNVQSSWLVSTRYESIRVV